MASQRVRGCRQCTPSPQLLRGWTTRTGAGKEGGGEPRTEELEERRSCPLPQGCCKNSARRPGGPTQGPPSRAVGTARGPHARPTPLLCHTLVSSACMFFCTCPPTAHLVGNPLYAKPKPVLWHHLLGTKGRLLTASRSKERKPHLRKVTAEAPNAVKSYRNTVSQEENDSFPQWTQKHGPLHSNW